VEPNVWNPDLDARVQLRELCRRAGSPGLLVVEFAGSLPGEPLPWIDLDPWTRSRAVTVADVRGLLSPPALDVALSCDLVFLRTGAQVLLPGPAEAPSSGEVWALARAGHAALAGGMLTGGAVSCDQAVRLGLAHADVADGQPLPLPDKCSLAALTTARDLIRSRATGGAGLALELASFRLLFASGDPREGARAFLERRKPAFSHIRSSPESAAE
jgi:enoyl-CoA hydratase/carnithine racemase